VLRLVRFACRARCVVGRRRIAAAIVLVAGGGRRRLVVVAERLRRIGLAPHEAVVGDDVYEEGAARSRLGGQQPTVDEAAHTLVHRHFRDALRFRDLGQRPPNAVICGRIEEAHGRPSG
jgi:hypothetical protein